MKTTYWFGHTIFRAAAKAFFRYQVVGRDKLITDGSVLVASNHESFLDPPLVGIAYNNSVYYLARKTLFRGVTKWLYSRWNAIPIDQDAPDMSSLKKIIISFYILSWIHLGPLNKKRFLFHQEAMITRTALNRLADKIIVRCKSLGAFGAFNLQIHEGGSLFAI